MAFVSKSEAARLAGVSRTTIHRYIKDGKLSATGGKVDESEIHRVFGIPLAQSGTPEQSNSSEQGVTQGERVLLRDQISQLESQVRDAKQDRDQWRDRHDQVIDILKAEQENIKLITDQRPSSGTGVYQIILAVVLVGMLLATVIYVSQ